MVCIFEGDSEIEGIFFCESDLFVGYFIDILVFLILLNWDIYFILGGICFFERYSCFFLVYIFNFISILFYIDYIKILK